MGQTIQQVVAHIDTTRERLGSNVEELERKIDATTDWRQHFQVRPFTFLSVAFAGGVMLAASLRGRSARRQYFSSSQPHVGTAAQKYHALRTWDNIKGALIGVAAARVKDYVGELIPGFREQFERTEHPAASFDTTAH
jgi:hypothetical protein